MRSTITIACCLALFLCTLSPVFADGETEVKQLANQAVQSFADKGKDYTLKLAGSSSGPFRKGEIYVYVMSFDGFLLAHPVNKKLEGKHQADFVDAKGMNIPSAMVEVARKDGEGWVEYWWIRHGEKD